MGHRDELEDLYHSNFRLILTLVIIPHEKDKSLLLFRVSAVGC